MAGFWPTMIRQALVAGPVWRLMRIAGSQPCRGP